MKNKKASRQRTPDPTLYYRATYLTSAGAQEQEVFISGSVNSAREYAAGPNARGRQLLSLEEFNQFIDSLL